MPRGLQEAYRTICSALLRFVRALGVDAELTGGEVNLQLPNPKTTVPCFEAPAGGEVVVGGRKLIGSAMRAHGGAVLQHGAILLDWDGRLQAGAMGLADDSGLRPYITTLAEHVGKPVVRADLERSIIQAFREELGVELKPLDIHEPERARAEKLEPSFVVRA